MIRAATAFLLTMFAGGAAASMLAGPLDNVWREVSASTVMGFAGSSFTFRDVKSFLPLPGVDTKLDNAWGEGNALAVATDLPFVLARAHTHAYESTDYSATTGSVADARLAFSVVADTRSGEPDTLGRVPVLVETRWHVSTDGNGSATVAAAFSGLLGINAVSATAQSDLFSDSDAGSLTQSVWMPVGSIIGVGMVARVGATAFYDKTRAVNLFLTGDARASLDPVFSFDQATFDAERAAAGLDTFKLDEVYQFVFSPGIQNLPAPSLVPLPPTAVMMLSGVVMLLVGGLRTRRACCN